MCEEQRGKSHAGTWVFSVVAVLVLYVLSWPPFLRLQQNGAIPWPEPKWVDDFYQPYFWIYGNTPLKQPFEAWRKLWVKPLPEP